MSDTRFTRNAPHVSFMSDIFFTTDEILALEKKIVQMILELMIQKTCRSIRYNEFEPIKFRRKRNGN